MATGAVDISIVWFGVCCGPSQLHAEREEVAGSSFFFFFVVCLWSFFLLSCFWLPTINSKPPFGSTNLNQSQKKFFLFLLTVVNAAQGWESPLTNPLRRGGRVHLESTRIPFLLGCISTKQTKMDEGALAKRPDNHTPRIFASNLRSIPVGG